MKINKINDKFLAEYIHDSTPIIYFGSGWMIGGHDEDGVEFIASIKEWREFAKAHGYRESFVEKVVKIMENQLKQSLKNKL